MNDYYGNLKKIKMEINKRIIMEINKRTIIEIK